MNCQTACQKAGRLKLVAINRPAISVLRSAELHVKTVEGAIASCTSILSQKRRALWCAHYCCVFASRPSNNFTKTRLQSSHSNVCGLHPKGPQIRHAVQLLAVRPAALLPHATQPRSKSENVRATPTAGVQAPHRGNARPPRRPRRAGTGWRLTRTGEVSRSNLLCITYFFSHVLYCFPSSLFAAV